MNVISFRLPPSQRLKMLPDAPLGVKVKKTSPTPPPSKRTRQLARLSAKYGRFESICHRKELANSFACQPGISNVKGNIGFPYWKYFKSQFNCIFFFFYERKSIQATTDSALVNVASSTTPRRTCQRACSSSGWGRFESTHQRRNSLWIRQDSEETSHFAKKRSSKPTKR